ncbi:MAG: AAA family ATPase [bacterium]
MSSETVLKSFHLLGLNGYRDVGVVCDSEVSIVIAENGSGKTTLLNAMYGVLSGRLERLREIDFRELVFEFTSQREPFRIEKATLFEYLTAPTEKGSENLIKLQQYGYSTDELFAFARALHGGRNAFLDTTEFRRLYANTPYSKEDLVEMLDTIAPANVSEAAAAAIREFVKAGMQGLEPLYLTTYRRIEAEVPEYKRESEPFYLRRSVTEKANAERLIFFGMRDVERRLEELTELIRRDTFDGYLQLSRRMLDELLNLQGNLAIEGELNVESLRTVLGRLGRMGEDSERRITQLVEAGRLQENKPLAYFLHQLSALYERQRSSEAALAAFVEIVNKYWEGSPRDKLLEFDKTRVRVRTRNLFTQSEIPLGALSSGEKQIVSIFARLLLDPGRKFLILIDEPELSLSIDWQRRFLVDLKATSGCGQLLAITHSPFVFDNELDEFARPLLVSNHNAD